MSSVPSATWRMLEQRVTSKPLPRGLDAAWDTGRGLVGRFVPRQRMFMARAEKVLALEKDFSEISDSKLRASAGELRQTFRLRRDQPCDLERAFALVREVAFRQIGEKPFPVQIAGAFAIESGCVTEMATGEGKTLACTLPATIAGWRGQGCHIITVNDYLAGRDSEWMGSVYRFCGLNVAHIENSMAPADRREAYLADITYCTNKEVTADFLRDRLTLGSFKGFSSALLSEIIGGTGRLTGRLVQRGLSCAIVDEADSVLIDEAVTPLIISGDAPNPEQTESFCQAAEIASQMNPESDYHVDFRYRQVELTNNGKECLSKLSGELGSIWKGARRSEELVSQALSAKELFLKDKHYVIDDGKIVIVDEFTGRLMPDRSWRAGLHQAVEAKEGLEVTAPKDTYARISFQRFFRMYNKLAGMTGTANESKAEFWQIYHLPVAIIPTNRPCVREKLPDLILPTESAKWQKIVSGISRIHKTGRPILIGTRSVHASEHLSKLLNTEELDHQVLNAVHHHKEAQIVAGAGQAGKITVATNMAGRGTDIKLGRGVADMGGLHVIASERHESARIDRQLFGRSGRQGDRGSAQAIVSLEDELISRYSTHIGSLLRRRYGNATEDISSVLTEKAFGMAQRRAEAMQLRQRKSVLRTDHWLDEQLGFAGTE